MKLVLIIMGIILSLSSCDKILVDDELTLNKKPYTSNQLQTDGYYFCKFGNIYRIYFLFRDGVVLSGGDVFEDKLKEQEVFLNLKKKINFIGEFLISIPILSLLKNGTLLLEEECQFI